MRVKILICIVTLVNAKQFNAGRHTPIAVKNINILRKKRPSRKQLWTQSLLKIMSRVSVMPMLYIHHQPIHNCLKLYSLLLMKNYLLSSKHSCYLFSFPSKGSEISISFSPQERILYFLISFYTFHPSVFSSIGKEIKVKK